MATFWERMLTQLIVCSLCIMSICTFFGFEGRTVVLISPVPGQCLPFTLYFGVQNSKESALTLSADEYE